MKRVVFFGILVGFFFGCCANTNCGPRDLDPGPECMTGDTMACDTGDLGVCAQGVKVCHDGFYSKCKPFTEPSEELCDGLDNDCNGEADAQCSLDLNSLPEYDGYIHTTRGGAALVTDNLISSIFALYSYSTRTGFVTFDLGSLNRDKIQSMELAVFLVDMGCEHGQPDFKVTLVDTGNIYDWAGQNCSVGVSCGALGCSSTYYPEGCIMPHSFKEIKTWSLLKDIEGWYTTGQSTDIRDTVLEYLSRYEDTGYFTFNVQVHCSTVYYPVNDGFSDFEDGENSGATGNLPTISVQYQE